MSEKVEKAKADDPVDEFRPLNVHPEAPAYVQPKERRYLLRHETAPLSREVSETEYREIMSQEGGHQWRIAKYWTEGA